MDRPLKHDVLGVENHAITPWFWAPMVLFHGFDIFPFFFYFQIFFPFFLLFLYFGEYFLILCGKISIFMKCGQKDRFFGLVEAKN